MPAGENNQVPWWYQLVGPAIGDPGGDLAGLAESERAVERGKLGEHLRSVAERYLPDSGISPGVIADVLMRYDPEHPLHASIVGELDEAMGAAAQGHARGISPSERKALGGSERVPDYLLGPGDQIAYGVLRDTNLVNAALGRRPVTDPVSLIEGGKTYEEGEAKQPLFGSAGAHPLNAAIQDYERGIASPERHSSLTGSHFPQHRLLSQDATPNSLDRAGDTIAGQTLSTFSQWSDASRAAGRRDDDNYGTTLAAADRWRRNIASELSKQSDYEWAKTATGRASPLVPDGLSPAKRDGYIAGVSSLKEKAGPGPTITEHAASQGKTYSPLAAWGMDFAHEFVDPVTPATIAVAGPVGFARAFAKPGATITGALLKGSTSAMGAEAMSEAAEPMNYAAAAFTFPWSAGTKMLTPPSIDSLPGGMVGREGYQKREASRDETLSRIQRARAEVR